MLPLQVTTLCATGLYCLELSAIIIDHLSCLCGTLTKLSVSSLIRQQSHKSAYCHILPPQSVTLQPLSQTIMKLMPEGRAQTSPLRLIGVEALAAIEQQMWAHQTLHYCCLPA